MTITSTYYFEKGRKGGYVAFTDEGKVILPARWAYQPAEEGNYVVKRLIDKGRFYIAEVLGPTGIRKIYACGHEKFERGGSGLYEDRVSYLCEECLDKLFEAHKDRIPHDLPSSFRRELLRRFRYALRKGDVEKALSEVQEKVHLFEEAIAVLKEAYHKNLPIKPHFWTDGSEGYLDYYKVGRKNLSKELSDFVSFHASLIIEAVTGVNPKAIQEKAWEILKEFKEKIKKDPRFRTKKDKWFICAKCGCQEFYVNVEEVVNWSPGSEDGYRPEVYYTTTEQRVYCKNCDTYAHSCEFSSKDDLDKKFYRTFEESYEKDGIRVFIKVHETCRHITAGSINKVVVSYEFSPIYYHFEAIDEETQKILEFWKKF